MDKIKLLCVGRAKESAIDSMSREYTRRINGFLPFSLSELKEPKGNRDNADDQALIDQFTRHIQDRDYLVTLDVGGEKMTSKGFAAWLAGHFSHNRDPLVFAIGGASGLPASLLQKSRFRLSFSDMTFPHDLFRIMFLEQLYRALAILHNHPYHR